MKVAIYFEYYLSSRLGGPPGYLHNLKRSLEDTDAADVSVEFYTLRENEDIMPSQSKPVDLPWWRPIKRFRHEKRRRRTVTRNAIEQLNWLKELPHAGGFESPLLSSALLSECDVLHAHTTIEAAKLIRATRDLADRPLVALMSHCPEAPSREWSEKFRSEGADPIVVEQFKRAYQEVDAFAFENVDFLIFPCAESREPYQNTMPGFGAIMERKPTYYVPTGSLPVKISTSREDVRSHYGIPRDAFVIGYIGRHNQIKGYDILSSVGIDVLNKNERTWIVCAGQEGPLKTPKHERWLEIGWTGTPGDLINAFDVFVLPNRETYFDLIGIEVLSVGTPLIASNRGGNKYLGRLSEGVSIFDDQDDLASVLHKFAATEPHALKKLREANRTAYADNFSLLEFAKNYRSAIKSALSDLGRH